jgi:hypothetical protein
MQRRSCIGLRTRLESSPNLVLVYRCATKKSQLTCKEKLGLCSSITCLLFTEACLALGLIVRYSFVIIAVNIGPGIPEGNVKKSWVSFTLSQTTSFLRRRCYLPSERPARLSSYCSSYLLLGQMFKFEHVVEGRVAQHGHHWMGNSQGCSVASRQGSSRATRVLGG